jgi:hypothetical protein
MVKLDLNESLLAPADLEAVAAFQVVQQMCAASWTTTSLYRSSVWYADYLTCA